MASLKQTKDLNLSMTKIFVLIVFLVGSAPVIAQQTNPRQPTPQQIRRVVTDFQSGISQGCLENASKLGLTPSYCNCYAKSFVDRYSPDELTAISNQALSDSQASNTISLMMRPEARACAVSNNRNRR